MKKKQTDPKAKPYKLCRNISIIFFLITGLCTQLDNGYEVTPKPIMFFGLFSFFVCLIFFIFYVILKSKFKHLQNISNLQNVKAKKQYIEKVWITDSGKQYHKDPMCSGMKNSYQVTKDEAISMGKEACKKCY